MRRLKEEDVLRSRERSKKKELRLKKEIVSKLDADQEVLNTMRSRSKLVLHTRLDNLIAVNKERYKTRRNVEEWAHRGYQSVRNKDSSVTAASMFRVDSVTSPRVSKLLEDISRVGKKKVVR